MTRAVLISGGNLGDVERTLAGALEMLENRAGRVVATSTIHYSDAWGFDAVERFANQVIVVDTELTALELLKNIWEIEAYFGRNREIENLSKNQNQRYVSRSLDIDILFYGDQTIDNEYLTVPHKLMCQREFVLRPLAEVMPEYCHPSFGKSVGELLDEII